MTSHITNQQIPCIPHAKLPELHPLAFGVALAMADKKGNSQSPQFIIGMGAQIGMVIL